MPSCSARIAVERRDWGTAVSLKVRVQDYLPWDDMMGQWAKTNTLLGAARTVAAAGNEPAAREYYAKLLGTTAAVFERPEIAKTRDAVGRTCLMRGGPATGCRDNPAFVGVALVRPVGWRSRPINAPS